MEITDTRIPAQQMDEAIDALERIADALERIEKSLGTFSEALDNG